MDSLEQQLEMIAASYANKAASNRAVNAAVATRLGGNAAMVQAASDGQPLADAKLETLHQLAEALTIDRGKIPASVVDHFRTAGLARRLWSR